MSRAHLPHTDDLPHITSHRYVCQEGAYCPAPHPPAVSSIPSHPCANHHRQQPRPALTTPIIKCGTLAPWSIGTAPVLLHTTPKPGRASSSCRAYHAVGARLGYWDAGATCMRLPHHPRGHHHHHHHSNAGNRMKGDVKKKPGSRALPLHMHTPGALGRVLTSHDDDGGSGGGGALVPSRMQQHRPHSLAPSSSAAPPSASTNPGSSSPLAPAGDPSSPPPQKSRTRSPAPHALA